MDTNTLDWVELEHLTSRLSDLRDRLQAVRASQHFGAVNAVEREISETASRRDRVVGLLSSRLADKVIASVAALATPAPIACR